MRPVLLFLAMVLARSAACQGSDVLKTATSDTARDTPVDTASVIDLGDCTTDEGLFVSVDTEFPAANLALTVSWTLSEPGTARVSYWSDGESVMTPESPEGTEGSQILRGLHAHGEVHLRVIATVDGEATCSDEITVEMGGLDPGLPVLSAVGQGDRDELVATPILQADSYYLALVDGTGEIRWAMELDTMPWKAQRANDGDAILFNTEATGLDAEGSIQRMGFDGESEVLWSAKGLHTDFTQLPDGTLASLSWDRRTVDDGESGTSVLGDRVVEYSPDGVTRNLWSVFSSFTPDLSVDWPSTDTGDPALDWSHANGISYDEANDAYLVSLAGLQSVVSIDRTTGEVNWVLGPDDGDLTPNPSDLLHNAHSIYAYGDDYIVFDRNDWGSGECSDVSSFKLDLHARSATLDREYSGSECLSVYYLGEARPLDDGGVLVVWATSGKLERLDADWNSQWSVIAALGTGFGFSDVLTTLYPTE